MGWSISTRDLTAVDTLARAASVWSKAEPWKTENTSWRPLADRRARHKRIVKLRDEQGYDCVLYDTAMVSYRTDGSVVLKVHDSISSRMFSHYMAPQGCSSISHHGEMYWQVLTPAGVRYYRPDRNLYLAPAGPGVWEAVGNIPEMPTEVAHDRKTAASARKLIKPYTDWLSLTERMLGHTAQAKWHLPDKADVAHLLAQNDDVAFFPKLAEAGGSAEAVRKIAYELTGANKVTPVPYDRLPRKAA